MQAGNAIDAQEIYSLVSEIPDPEIPVITIQELGILRKVEFVNKTCIVTITPTYTACPAMGLLESQIKEVLKQYNIADVEVQLTYSPAWTTDWMNESAKKKLKDYGIAPPQHSSCSKFFATETVQCPRCNSKNTEMISRYGSTACKALYKCLMCKEPFEHFKCH